MLIGQLRRRQMRGVRRKSANKAGLAPKRVVRIGYAVAKRKMSEGES